MPVFSVFLFLIAFASNTWAAGAACVMAKWQGNTLGYVLRVVDGNASAAQEAAKRALREQGYARFNGHLDIRHPQALTHLAGGYAVVVKATYPNGRQRARTSYGCGFAASSLDDALWGALRNLQAHSWGWKPDTHGYEVVEQRRF